MKRGKRYAACAELVDQNKEYTAQEALELIDKMPKTKFDETISLGSLLNICYKTKIRISYIATGQNVPDDIEIMSPEKIAKSLLGLGGDS